MAFFEWSADMAIDGGVIDQDHQQLIALVNQLHRYTAEGQGREVVGEVLAELLGYTEAHFRREEQLMVEWGFPDLPAHRVKHERLVLRMQELQRLHDAGSMAVAALLSVAMRDWLSLHIRRSDREIRAHRQGGGGPPGS